MSLKTLTVQQSDGPKTDNNRLKISSWFSGNRLSTIVNFPFLCSNIPPVPAYGVYISQLI